MKRDEIEKRVNDVLNEVLGVDYSEIKGDAVLSDDLDVDSLDAVEIVMGLEHEFGISIPDEKMYGNKSYTVKDVYDLVEELL
jgi:acyl carrier protein